MSDISKSVIIILIILTLDQVLKIWIKTHMMIGEEFHLIGDWFIIHFTENEGMAFGWKLGDWAGAKLFLSLLRIAAVFLIGYFIYDISRKKAGTGLLVCVSLIMAGALGNIIDSVFYGVLFTDSYGRVAEFLPEGGGYAGWLHGRVVDMFYLPIAQGTYPEWIPKIGGTDFLFFRPVFNLADASITTGVLVFIVFQKRFLRRLQDPANQTETQPTEPQN